MAKKETAEEKLLKIIEASKKAKGVAAALPASPALSKAPGRRIVVTVQQINIALIVLLVAGFLFLVNEIRRGNILLGQDVSIPAEVVEVQDAGGVAVPSPKGLSYYFERIALRNIFQPFDKSAQEKTTSAGKDDVQLKMSNYKLVGVAWLDVPESATAMVENTAKKTTHFLREGDKIDDVKVKAIYTDRVVFSYANEEITIKL